MQTFCEFDLAATFETRHGLPRITHPIRSLANSSCYTAIYSETNRKSSQGLRSSPGRQDGSMQWSPMNDSELNRLPDPSRTKHPFSILCIDDEKLGLEIRKAVLEHAGYHVLTALDGVSALKIFRSQPIDGVVLDYFMPGMHGGQVAAEMRKSHPNIPILLLTANINLPQEVSDMAEVTMLKGEGPVRLLEKIQFMLQQHRGEIQ